MKIDKKSICKKWELYGEPFMTIEILKNSKPELHSQYMAITKAGYLAVHGFRNGLNRSEYCSLKHLIITRIIQWAQRRYRNGQESIPDTLYDYFNFTR